MRCHFIDLLLQGLDTREKVCILFEEARRRLINLLRWVLLDCEIVLLSTEAYLLEDSIVEPLVSTTGALDHLA